VEFALQPRAVNGHEAVTPLSSLMNSRRFMASLPPSLSADGMLFQQGPNNNVGSGQTLPIRTVWTVSGLPWVTTELRTSRIGSFGPEPEVSNHLARAATTLTRWAVRRKSVSAVLSPREHRLAWRQKSVPDQTV
jgi:hypothetical protein